MFTVCLNIKKTLTLYLSYLNRYGNCSQIFLFLFLYVSFLDIYLVFVRFMVLKKNEGRFENWVFFDLGARYFWRKNKTFLQVWFEFNFAFHDSASNTVESFWEKIVFINHVFIEIVLFLMSNQTFNDQLLIDEISQVNKSYDIDCLIKLQ